MRSLLFRLKRNATYSSRGICLTTVKELAERILTVFRETAERKGVGEVPAASLYKRFEREGSHDMIQQAIRYLLDRDFIAPHTYSLTAKGRIREVGGTEGEG
jgi:hypothetical protein